MARRTSTRDTARTPDPDTATRTTVIALAVAAAVVFLVLPAVPGLAMVSTAIAVLGTVLLAWFFRSRQPASEARPAQPVHLE